MSSADERFLFDYMEEMRRLIAPDPPVLELIRKTRDLWLSAREREGRVIFLGNGGSAGIASHLAIDTSKNARVPAICFNDGSMITCLANDYGFENWMARALQLNARSADCLVAISSSGRSRNLLNAVAAARELKMSVVTLSGMTADNPLRALGDINFWADSRAYNLVETTHQFWMMCVIDLIIGKAEYPAS
jgi:phosphoheptose isomerase